MKCPGFEQVIDYLDGKLAQAAAERIAAHLATACTACADTRAWYESLRRLAASDDTVAPPAWVFKQAVRIFDAPRRPQLGERIGEAIARLVFDSFARTQLAGIRSTETANRQLLYRAGEYSIDLQVVPTTEARGELIGQVLREGDANFDSVANLRLEITSGNRLPHATVTDARGEFKFSDMDYENYDLRIELADGRITIPRLPLTRD